MRRATLVEHPNREKAASRTMRIVVLTILALSGVLISVTTARGWDLMQEARTLNIVFVGIHIVFIVQVLRWSRGVLPMAAGIAAFVGIFAGTSISSWYERDAPGYADATLSGQLGFLTVVILAVQIAIIVVTIAAFGQRWQEEVERAAPSTPAHAAAS
jgi:hypothetical protein